MVVIGKIIHLVAIGRRMQLNFSCHNLPDFRQIVKTTDVTGNPFDWLEYSANLCDNSRSYIVSEVL